MTLNAFDFTIDMAGACVISTKDRLSVACLTDGEINHWIAALKSDLDRVAISMKIAVKEQAKKNPFER